jgi:hypothetical protein
MIQRHCNSSFKETSAFGLGNDNLSEDETINSCSIAIRTELSLAHFLVMSTTRRRIGSKDIKISIFL